MRIGLIIYGSLDTLSGGYLYDRMLVEHLRWAGDEVSVISLPYRNYVDHLTDNLSSALVAKLAKHRFDFLLQDELNHPSLFWLNRTLRRRAPYQIVSIVHHLRTNEDHPAPLKLMYRFIERMYLNTVHGFIYNGQTTKTEVEKLTGKSRPHIVAVPGGNRFAKTLPADRITNRVHRDGPLKVLFVGNVIPRKGLHTLLDALARLDHERWRLTVVGNSEVDKPYAARIVQQVARLGISRNVNVIGPVSGSDLADQYSNHHILAVPSSYEGYGIAYLEAMAFGMPGIGSTAGGASEIITNNINGFLVTPGVQSVT